MGMRAKQNYVCVIWMVEDKWFYFVFSVDVCTIRKDERFYVVTFLLTVDRKRV